MHDRVHPYWGRVQDSYDSTYVHDLEEIWQKAKFSPRISDALHDDGTEVAIKLRALGDSPGDPDWEDAKNRITLPMLQSVVHFLSFGCSLPKLGNPLVIRGCIKLMKSITRFGRPSPFSYEYGHLCFRILVVAFDFCVLKLSDHYDDWIANVSLPQHQGLKEGHVPMLSETVSELITDCMDEGDDSYYADSLAPHPWTDSHTGPLITPADLILLCKILDDDRKHFLIFLRSNYSLRLSALIYTFYHHMLWNPSSPESQPLIEAFHRIYPRYLLTAPDYPFGEGRVHEDIMRMSRAFSSTRQLLNMEDSNLLLRAYVDRLTVLSDSPLHLPASSILATELLQYVLPLVSDGCEPLIPSVICATIRCMRKEVDKGDMDGVPLVDTCLQLLDHIKYLLQFLVARAQVNRDTVNKAMDVVFDEELVGLASILSWKAPTRHAQLVQSTTDAINALRAVDPLGYLLFRANKTYAHAAGLILVRF